jgi:membrane-bound lytic murein transglycosylase B
VSLAPRGSRARGRSVREGGRRVAALVAVAGITAAAVGTPSVADTTPTEPCQDPVGVTVAADGHPAACPAPTPSEPPADPSAETSESTGSSTTAPTGPVAATTAVPDTPVASDTPSALAGGSTDQAAPQPIAPVAATVTSDPTPQRPAAEGVVAAPPPAPGRGDRQGAARRSPHAGDRSHDHRAPRRPRADEGAGATSAPPSGSQGPQAVPAVSLPADWTSLDPIVLPAFSLRDFPVPAELLPLFQAAGAEYGVPWEVLAAINEIETAYGRNAHMSSAGAIGFMQFMPSTWRRWGRDADGDRRRDPRNPADAIFSAARYLHAAGAAHDLGRAIFAYNHAGWYVDEVLHRARELAGLDTDRVAALTDHALTQHRALYEVAGSPFFGPGVLEPTAGQALLMTTRQLTRRVLNDDRIDIYACGRQDIEDGRIDRRVLATLLFLAESGYRLQISSLDCGHSRLTTSGNVSAHSYGAAVDIAAVNGIPILGHQGPGSITDEVVHRLLDLQGLMRPAQIISLMTVDGATNTLALPDHDDHIHVGFGRAVELPAN